jgi:transposase
MREASFINPGSSDFDHSDIPTDPTEIRALLRAAREQGRLEGHAQGHREGVDASREAMRLAYEAQIQRYETEVQRLEAQVQRFYEQIATARRRMFGPSSEAAQGRLFDEAEALAVEDGDDALELPPLADSDKSAPKDKKPRGKRAALSPELPRVDIVHELPEDQRLCACCGAPMVEIGQEVSEQLDIVPMRFQVLRHIRRRYACAGGDHSAPKTAPAPPAVLPKSNASASTLAMLATAKYVDGQPLARLEYVSARAGVPIARQTSARWMIRLARDVLQPLHNLMRDTLLDGDVIHMDETTVQVLREPGKTAQSTSYMWVACGGDERRRVVLFDYDCSRSRAVPQRLLQGWSGSLMTDGYEGYNAVVAAQNIRHLACWAHVRRRFVDAAKLQPKGKKGLADEAIAMIGELYRVERDAAGLDDEARWQMRQQRSRPQLDALRTWLDRVRPGVPPKLALGQALAYMDSYWSKLVRFVERGDLPIDNNRAENAIRPFVIGRKNWLFSNTQAGAHASAVLYSLFETAKANGREPYLWLRHVLERIPNAKTADDFDALLPWNLHPLHSSS